MLDFGIAIDNIGYYPEETLQIKKSTILENLTIEINDRIARLCRIYNITQQIVVEPNANASLKRLR